MSKLKKEINIWAIITAISFLYLAFCPYILNPIYNILLKGYFPIVVRDFFTSIKYFGDIINSVACIVMAIGAFTRFDKIAVTVSSAIFWLGYLVNLITEIVNYIRYDYYRLEVDNLVSPLAYMFTYFLFFTVGLWLTILFFTKKPTPKFLKVITFIPVVVLVLIMVFSFFTNILAIISFLGGAIISAESVIDFLVYNTMNIFNRFVLLIGFTAVTVKLADLKKKPKNTVEISEAAVENVTVK